MYCETIYGWPVSSPISKTVTICGWSPSRPHCLRLAAHPREAVRVQAFGLDDGDGDIAVQLRVVRQVDALTPALAEEALHGVAAIAEG